MKGGECVHVWVGVCWGAGACVCAWYACMLGVFDSSKIRTLEKKICEMTKEVE